MDLIPKLTLGVMAKYWAAGEVKTRLGKSIGMRHSARIHRLFVDFLATSLGNAADECQLVVSPADRVVEMAAAVARPWKAVPQTDGDLGGRMQAWFRDVLNAGTSAILIGADAPLVDPALIARAAEILQRKSVVLGPAEDGGYYLVGIRGDCPEAATILFDAMIWSHESVMEVTRDRLKLAEITFGELSSMQDVDTLMDLHAVREEIRVRGELPAGAAEAGLPPERLVTLLRSLDAIVASTDSSNATDSSCRDDEA